MNFLFVILALFGLVFFYIWRRLIVSAHLPHPWELWFTAGLIALFIFEATVPVFLRTMAHQGKKEPVWLEITVYSFLGFLAILFFSTVFRDIIWTFLKIFPSETLSHAMSDPQRRLFLTRAFNWGAVGLALGATAMGTRTALKGPEVKRVEVPVKNLHGDLDGVTIAQISDLHIGAIIDLHRVEKMVKMVNELDADFVMLTGDVADGYAADLRAATSPLKALKARYGKFYVTGNHEYYWDVDSWAHHLEELDFRYLYNAHQIVAIKQARLLIGGVADIMCKRIRPDHHSSPKESIQGGESADFKIILAHQPSSCFEAVDAGYDLQLSGHTHDGQFFPNNLIVRFFHPYVEGLHFHKNKMWVYVNVGTGFWGPPQRLGIPSEITLLKLKKV